MFGTLTYICTEFRYKPALSEWYKKHPVSTKICLFENPHGHTIPPSAPRSSRLRRSNSAPRLCGSHISFLRKRSLGVGLYSIQSIW